MEKGREKRKSTLSISSRVSHSKNFEAKQHESTRGNTRPRQFPSLNSRGAKYSTDIRVNGAFWPSKYQRKDIPSPFQRRSIESKVVWKCCQLPLDAHPLRDDYARPPSIHATHLCLRLCTGAIYTLSPLSSFSPRPRIRDIRLPREYARHMDPHATRASTVQTLRADCYSGASPVFSRTQPSD